MSFLSSPYDYLQAHKTVIFGILLGFTFAGLAYEYGLYRYSHAAILQLYL